MKKPPYYPPCFALLSGGKDSWSVVKVLEQADRLLSCVALGTGIATPEWRDFLIDECHKRGYPLEFYHTPEKYEDYVRQWGFPGPSKHPHIMNLLKGRAIREFRRKHPNGILASGTRKNESNRRFINAKPFSFWEGAPIIAPIYDWTNDETWAFFNAHGFVRAPAYQTLMISGDCLCGSFAVQGEAEALRLGYPKIAEHFDALGKEVAGRHPKRCKWGWGWQQDRKQKTSGEMAVCQECLDFNNECEGAGV